MLSSTKLFFVFEFMDKKTFLVVRIIFMYLRLLFNMYDKNKQQIKGSQETTYFAFTLLICCVVFMKPIY